MTKFDSFNSPELSIIKEVFNELSYLQLDINIAYIIESYIYAIVKEYHFNKEKDKIRCEYRTKYGLKDGYYKEWHSNGRLVIECSYSQGKIDGEYRQWFELNQRLYIKCNYKNGKLDGEYKEWYYYKSRLKLQSTYKEGKIDGEYKLWDENGKLGKQLTFVDGVRIDN